MAAERGTAGTASTGLASAGTAGALAAATGLAAAALSQKAQKWAETFGGLDEEDAYTYLEELAPHLDRMHVQFLQGIIGYDDDDDEDDLGEEDDGEEV